MITCLNVQQSKSEHHKTEIQTDLYYTTFYKWYTPYSTQNIKNSHSRTIANRVCTDNDLAPFEVELREFIHIVFIFMTVFDFLTTRISF